MDRPGDQGRFDLAEAPGVAEALSTDYGLTARSARRLGGEFDTNVRVECTDGGTYVVKTSPAGADEAEVRWHLELLARAGAAGVPVPSVVAARDGSPVSRRDGRLTRVFAWLPGRPLEALDRHSPALLREWGEVAARLTVALRDVPAGPAPTHHWDLLRAGEAVARHRACLQDDGVGAVVDRIMGRYGDAAAVARELPRQVVHQDLNDFNVLASPAADGVEHVSGVLDFADALVSARVCELAVAVAYALLRKADPLVAAGHVVRGFDDVVHLSDTELEVVWPLACARLCVNLTTWAARSTQNPEYAQARSAHTAQTLLRAVTVVPELAVAHLHEVVGRGWRRSVEPGASPAFAVPIAFADLEVGGGGPEAAVFAGRHLTSRDDHVLARRSDDGEPATVHLGVDVHGLTGTSVRAPLAGTVHEGSLVQHEGLWSRWQGLRSMPVGSAVAAGDVLGDADEVVTVSLFPSRECAETAPTWVPASLVGAWRAVSPDPASFLRVGGTPDAPGLDVDEIVHIRDDHFARSQRSYYRSPMALVRGDGAWLYDSSGRGYLDAINNVSHVGHANRAVAAAAARQLRLLNTNSRFVYEGLADYSQRLAALLPDPLEVVFLVCTGSEANDLALRIARQVTGREHVLVVEGAYHGNTTAVTGISPNRYRGPGGAGPPVTTREVPQPNRYRGRYRYDHPDPGAAYAADAAAVVSAPDAPPAAFFAESLMGTAGTIVYPPGYLRAVFDTVRAAGGLCVSDEVQVGFGRLGDVFWGFESHGVVPDIVTMGKPIGNGHPMAAVVTTRAIANAFDSGMKYFNTFGGSPVSCAIGSAVLDEIERLDLQAHALRVGADLMARLKSLQDRHDIVGDVRGAGLYLGVELVRSRETLEPAGAEARLVSERMKDEGCIVYPTGPGDNVLKIKPPMVFDERDARWFVETLDAVLTREW